MSYLGLVSGSDLRGTALPMFGKPVTLTKEAARIAAWQFAAWVKEGLGRVPHIAVGHDSRLSAQSLKAAMLEGFAAAGAKVTDCGLCTTPAMFMATVLSPVKADAAAMITASHLPADRNGIKFFTRKGGLSSNEVKEIARRMDECGPLPSVQGMVDTLDFLPHYSEFLCGVIREGTGEQRPLEGLSIVLDACSGSGGFYAKQVLAELGADVSGSIWLEPNGNFPGHAPNPEDAKAMDALGHAVISAKADLGLIFDADADRAALCDSKGRAIARNKLVALCSAAVLEANPGATIVTDSITSTGLTRFISERGGVHHRFKRGYRNVIDEAIRLNNEGNNCPLAIETSGHAALRDNYFLDDGAYLVSWLLIQAAKLRKRGLELTSLIHGLREPAEEYEARLSITETDFRNVGMRAIEAITAYSCSRNGWRVLPNNYEGVRVHCEIEGDPDAAWFLARMSLHDPVLPINIESDAPGGLNSIKAELHTVLSSLPGLDLNPLV